MIRADRAPPPAYNDRDDDYDDDDGSLRRARKFSGPAPYGQACAQSEQVRDRLTGMGWRDFHGGQPQGEMVTLRARRPNGRLFELTMHRCTGADRRGAPAGTPPLRAVCLQSPGQRRRL